MSNNVNNKGYEDIGFAKIDHDRQKRQGYPEVIFGAGKTCEQAAVIFKRIKENGNAAVCTRASKEMAETITALVPEAEYIETAKIVIYNNSKKELKGQVCIATGGTSDIPVAEEAAVILEAYGSKAVRLYDVGVAGIHRLMDNVDILRSSNCIIAVAGMEGRCTAFCNSWACGSSCYSCPYICRLWSKSWWYSGTTWYA